jgi:hypothetical protein
MIPAQYVGFSEIAKQEEKTGTGKAIFAYACPCFFYAVGDIIFPMNGMHKRDR